MPNMKRILLIILLFCLAVPFSQGQLWRMRRWEASAAAGPSFFFGDVGGYSRTKNLLGFRDLTYLQTRFDINGNFKYRITRVANIRLSMTYALFNATDVRGSNEDREYQSKTSLFEPALLGEYYFIKNRAEMSYLFIKGRRSFFSQILRSLDFYAFAGIGGALFYVDPNEALLARDMPVSGFTPVIPGGVGATLIYNPNLNFGVELGGRYAFSDYIDGYSSPQFSKANDVYYFLNFTIAYKLKTGPHGWPSFR